MAVRVMYSVGVGNQVDEHEVGTAIEFKEGHLTVYGEGSKRIAVYAPGKWVKGEVVSKD